MSTEEIGELDDVGIILQGPTTYCREMVDCYNKWPQVIWSTWEDEPVTQLEHIRSSGVKLLVNKKPSYPGYRNINLQCCSTYCGLLELAKNYNLKSFVKIRSDITVDNLEAFLWAVKQSLQRQNLSFLGYSAHNGGYLLDYVVAGNIVGMVLFWEPDIVEQSGYPWPEKWLQDRVLPQEAQADLTRFFTQEVSLIKYRGYQLNWLRYQNPIEVAAVDSLITFG